MSAERLLSLIKSHLDGVVIRPPSLLQPAAVTSKTAASIAADTPRLWDSSSSNTTSMNSVACDWMVYKMVDGIPQGSVLSSVLCDIYYSSMERCLFNSELADIGACYTSNLMLSSLA